MTASSTPPQQEQQQQQRNNDVDDSAQWLSSLFHSFQQQPQFRSILASWLSTYLAFAAVNLSLILGVGGRLSEVATIVMMGALVGYHYVLYPTWHKHQKQKQQLSTKDSKSLEATKRLDEEFGSSSLEEQDSDIEIGEQQQQPPCGIQEIREGSTSDEEEAAECPPSIVVEVPEQALVPSTTAAPPAPTTTTNRMAFLDNVKVFLTILVVTHHTADGFGAGHAESFYLVIGMDANPVFLSFLRAFSTINQAYFMPLFFFLSAYFVPSSYEKYGPKAFLQGKRHRLLWPACITWATVCPACMIVQQVVRQNYDEIFFIFAPGHIWFLFWLLLLCWIYSSFYEATKSNTATATATIEVTKPPTPTSLLSFPSTMARMAWGGLICGLLQWLVVFSFAGIPMVAMMPLKFGSMACDGFMFAMGVLAKRNHWFTTATAPQTEQSTTKATITTSIISGLAGRMDMNPWFLRFLVFLEGVVLVTMVELYYFLNSDASPNIGVAYLSPLGVPFYLVAGIFCVDMGLAVLQFFQQFANTQNDFSKFLSQAAYTVYLIHPIVVVAGQTAFIYGYNALVSDQNQIFFPDLNPDDPQTRAGQGGGECYGMIGWALVTVVTHLITWPLGYWISKLPGLTTML